MLTFTSGEANSTNQLTTACPASWKAMVFFSSSLMILDFFSKPPTMRSTASKKSWWVTNFRSLRAANRAASLQTLAMSAPLKPGVCLDKNSMSTDVSVLIGRRCTSKMDLRSTTSGMST